jgi:hypothetical protein
MSSTNSAHMGMKFLLMIPHIHTNLSKVNSQHMGSRHKEPVNVQGQIPIGYVSV